jgi:hypothetical protein
MVKASRSAILQILYVTGLVFLLVLPPIFASFEVQVSDTMIVATSTIVAAGLGSYATYLFLTHNERTKENEFRLRVKIAIQHELNLYYEVIDEALRIGKAAPDRADTLAIERSHPLCDKYSELDFNSPKIYLNLNIEIKLRALDASMILRLDQLYEREIIHSHGYIWFNDTPFYLGIRTDEGKKLKDELAVVIDLLN